jgi:hypothetical protein
VRGEFEASERQTLGINVEQAAGELAKAHQALAELPPVPEVTPEQLLYAELALEDRDDVLKACEGSLRISGGFLLSTFCTPCLHYHSTGGHHCGLCRGLLQDQQRAEGSGERPSATAGAGSILRIKPETRLIEYMNGDAKT